MSARERARTEFLLSIDTEEDNWIPARHGITTANIRAIPVLGERLRRLGVRPTYFVAYQAAASEESAAVLRAEHARGGSEIGAHLHPWNTPPECGLEDYLSMLKDYPETVQERKMRALVEAIESNIGVKPRAFRAGRFGFAASTVPALLSNDLIVDSSVTPLLNWKSYDNGPSFVRAPFEIYRFDPEHPLRPAAVGAPLIEVPVSVGYTRFGPHVWHPLASLLDKSVARRMHLSGIASRLGLFQRVILSPETNSVPEMVAMSRRLISGGVNHLHMFLHSNSLTPGMGPFAADSAGVERILDRIDGFVDAISRFTDLAFETVSETAFRFKGAAT